MGRRHTGKRSQESSESIFAENRPRISPRTYVSSHILVTFKKSHAWRQSRVSSFRYIRQDTSCRQDTLPFLWTTPNSSRLRACLTAVLPLPRLLTTTATDVDRTVAGGAVGAGGGDITIMTMILLMTVSRIFSMLSFALKLSSTLIWTSINL